jgi:dihydropyrimidine dehydrogenase (NAD+) subunit PreT
MTPGELIPELHPSFTSQEAVVEANRCLYCFDAPCTNACPTHIDVPRFIKKIATGNLQGSAETILSANILGLSCSRVCPVDILCEGACVMHGYSRQPIEIGRLQRHAMEHFYANGPRLAAHTPETNLRVACVGAGPASLSCAAHLRLHGVAVTIFDRHPRAGGLNTYGVAEYKFRSADSDREVDFIRSLGVEFRTGTNIGVDVSFEDLERNFDAIFLGPGLGAPGSLNIPGIQLSGVIDALQFIAAYKTSTPAPLGRRAVVVGGGNTAIDAAIAAKLLGAEEVTLIYRRGESEMPAFTFEYEHARRDGVRFLWHSNITSINGEAHVESVICEAAREPARQISCDTVIIAVGQSRGSAYPGVEMHEGKVAIDPLTGQTANPKYFAGGDCVNGGREVVDAVADGKRAANGILQWLT